VNPADTVEGVRRAPLARETVLEFLQNSPTSRRFVRSGCAQTSGPLNIDAIFKRLRCRNSRSCPTLSSIVPTAEVTAVRSNNSLSYSSLQRRFQPSAELSDNVKDLHQPRLWVLQRQNVELIRRVEQPQQRY
jgi:hypothetical protein